MMDEHDDEMRPVNLEIGWNRGVKDAQGVWPDVVDPSLLSCPWQLPFMDLSKQPSGSVPSTSHMRPQSNFSHSGSGFGSKGKAPSDPGYKSGIGIQDSLAAAGGLLLKREKKDQGA
ncbi:hypothetical protein AgCh_028520 [Apium graveolens]